MKRWVVVPPLSLGGRRFGVQAGKIINKPKELTVIQRALISEVARETRRDAHGGGEEERTGL